MKNVLILDTGKEWGGGTNSLIELLKRTDKARYRFTAMFYNNCKKGDHSDVKTEMESIGIDFLLLEQKKQSGAAKILKELFRILFFFNKKLRKYSVFLVDYQFRIKPNAQRISDTLRRLGIDLLYMNNQPSTNMEGILASKETGVPVLQHSRIEATLNSFEVRTVNRWLKKIICVSEGVRDSLIRQGVAPSKCAVVHNGIYGATQPAIAPWKLRRELMISDGDILIGTVGSLVKRKRISDLIEAVSLIMRGSKHPAKCIIVGEGPEQDNLAAHIRKRALHNVLLTGFQPDAISFINMMDIFVLPSEQEGLPRVILEAMLLAKPVIASNVTGPSELVLDRETGFLVPSKNPEEIANALLKLLDSPELREQMGQKGRKRVIERFSIERYVAGVENVFEEVITQ